MTKSFFSFIKDFYKQNKKSAIILTAGSLFWAFTFPVGSLLLGYIIDQLKVMEHAGSRGYAPGGTYRARVCSYTVFAKLDLLIQDKTDVVVAHRLSTLRKMDRIIVLDQGQIAEVGTHQALLERKGVFYSLWQQQSGGFF